MRIICRIYVPPHVRPELVANACCYKCFFQDFRRAPCTTVDRDNNKSKPLGSNLGPLPVMMLSLADDAYHLALNIKDNQRSVEVTNFRRRVLKLATMLETAWWGDSNWALQLDTLQVDH